MWSDIFVDCRGHRLCESGIRLQDDLGHHISRHSYSHRYGVLAQIESDTSNIECAHTSRMICTDTLVVRQRLPSTV